jgi:hypothetical protein
MANGPLKAPLPAADETFVVVAVLPPVVPPEVVPPEVVPELVPVELPPHAAIPRRETQAKPERATRDLFRFCVADGRA